MAPKTDVIEQLRARIAELEEEILIERSNGDHWRDAYSKWVNTDESARRLIELQEQLAAAQLNNKLLRKALEAVIKVHGYESGIPVEALAQPSDTFALDAYVAEKVKDVQLQDIEQYRLQMAGISTAAIGYWKEDDSIHPDYDTPALHDVAKLYANYESRTKQCDLAVETLNDLLEFAIDSTCGKTHAVESARQAIAAIKESEK